MMKVKNLTINMTVSKPSPSIPTSALIAAIIGQHEEASSQPEAPAKLPAIGQPWPRVDGIYAGIAKAEDGEPAGHLVLLNASTPEEFNWEDAKAWTVKQGDGARLPTRTEAALLYVNLRDQINPKGWQWTCTPYSDSSAWSQLFSHGDQYYYGHGARLRCRAVRRFPA